MSHILMCSISYDRHQGGGGVRLVYDLAQGLVQQGHQVTVICEDLHGLGSEREIDDRVTVLRYRLPPVRGLAARRHHDHIAAASELLRKYLTEAPDVVHGHSLFQYVAALRLYRERAHCCYSIHSPFVAELRIGWGAQGAAGKLKQWFGLPVIRRLETECLRNSDALTAESEYTRTLIRRLYGASVAERIVTIPGWVDLRRFQPLPPQEVKETRSRLGWATDRPVFFVLRRLEVRMGLDNLLYALRQVRGRGYVFHAYIGGSGSQLSRLLQLRESLRLEDAVTFMGFVAGDRLPLAYAACDASIVPTAQLECFGLIALESIACGRPALVTPVGALPEVVSTFEPRWIAHGSEPAAIAQLLCAYLGGELPIPPPDQLRDALRRQYSFEAALQSYEKLLLSATETTLLT